MNDLRKAAEMALKQLQRDDVYLGHRSKTRADAIEALRQALDLQTAIEKGTKAWADVPNGSEWVEELRGYDTPEVTPEVNEPEGWVKIDEVRHFLDSVGCGTIYKTAGEGRVPLYAASYTKLDTTAGVLHKEWVGLTDEVKANWKALGLVGVEIVAAHLKEKNT